MGVALSDTKIQVHFNEGTLPCDRYR